MRSLSREDKVSEFNVAGGHKTFADGGDLDIQIELFSEELSEFAEAMAAYHSEPTEDNRKKMIKEWADVQVTLSNFGWFFNIDGEAAFNRVHESNMSKVVNGKLFKRADGKILKPDTYKAPDMSGL